MTVGRLERSPIHLLHRAGQCAADIFQGEMVEGDLTPRQYAILLTVAQNEGLSQTHLVEKTGIDRSTMTDIIGRLQSKGLVSRSRSLQDARSYEVKLTAAGHKQLETARAIAAKVDEHLLAAIPVESQRAFAAHLHNISLNREDPVDTKVGL